MQCTKLFVREISKNSILDILNFLNHLKAFLLLFFKGDYREIDFELIVVRLKSVIRNIVVESTLYRSFLSVN